MPTLLRGPTFRSETVSRSSALPDWGLDFALVAVQPVSVDGSTTLDNYGYLNPRPQSGKALEDEFVSIIPGPGQDPYEPTNYKNEFLGPVTLRYALEKSINVPSWRWACVARLNLLR